VDANRKTAVIIGTLFLISYLGVFAGPALYSPVLDSPAYLANAFPEKTRVITGILIELLNDAAVIGIAVMFFPILKKQSERLALGLVGFRIVEAVTLVVGKISALSLIAVSRQYLQAGSPDDSSFQALGASVLAGRHWAGQMTAVFFILGALIFYDLLYRSKILPRFIPVWGFIGVALLIVGNLIGEPGMSQEFQPVMLLFLPIVLNELFLAIWLIARGFNASADILQPQHA